MTRSRSETVLGSSCFFLWELVADCSDRGKREQGIETEMELELELEMETEMGVPRRGWRILNGQGTNSSPC